MAESLKTYVVELAGIPHTMKLSERDAKRYNATPIEQAQAKQRKPANKGRAARTK
jgi:hypothetical protein